MRHLHGASTPLNCACTANGDRARFLFTRDVRPPSWKLAPRRGVAALPMHDSKPERRRYIRSRADLEFQLARITLALSRAPMARRADVGEWFDEAACALLEHAAPEHRDYLQERVAGIRDTFFHDAAPPREPGADAPRRLH